MANYRAQLLGMVLGLFGLAASFVGCSGSSVQSDPGCEQGDKHYAVGDSFPASDGCNRCTCGEHGNVQCTLSACGADLPDCIGPDGASYLRGAQVSDDGCNTCSCTGFNQITCTARDCADAGPSCEARVSEMKATLSKVQECQSAADCGQRIPGSSCGCTRDLIARKDADLAWYLAQRSQVSELGCATEGGSTCDCPDANGFACIDNVCTWNYVNVEPEPTCQPTEAAELCVRGTPTSDGELLAAGDPLQVTARSAGCLSSSCSRVVEASCTIESNVAFDVKADFCVANTARAGKACTDDCGTAHADCSFGQPLTVGEHQVRLGSIAVGFQVPSKLPLGGLCASSH